MADEKTRILNVNKGEKEKTPITAAPPEEDAVRIKLFTTFYTLSAADHSILRVGRRAIPTGGPLVWRVPGQAKWRQSLRGTCY